MIADDIDLLADCLDCGRLIDHYAGVPGSEFMTPYWLPAADDSAVHPHPVRPNPDTIREVQR